MSLAAEPDSPDSPDLDRPDLTDRPVVLSARELHKRFGAIEAVRGVGFEIHEGETYGLLGPNGAGKTTTISMICGLLARDGGEVQRPGRLGYCPQMPMLWEKLTVAEHFALFARAYGMDDGQRDSAAGGLLEELQFSRYRGYRVEELSGGTRQKLNLALALMHEPELLLLDEPYAGFDWETYLRFWEMSERRRDTGMGILIVSHFLTERERLDRVYTLADGRTSET